MKRTTLLGSVAAGLLAAAAATPAWAQATTYPEGTDCSAIQNSASKMECMNQLNESRQNPDPGLNSAPSTTTAPGAATAPANQPGAGGATAAPGAATAPASPLNSSPPAGATSGTTGGTGTTTP